MFLKLLKYHSGNIFTLKKVLFCQVFFILNSYLFYSNYSNMVSDDQIKTFSVMFFLPINPNLDLFRWILLLLPFLLITHSFLFQNLKESPTYLLLRMKDSMQWFHSLFVTSFVFIIFNLCMGFILTRAVVFFHPYDATKSLYSLAILNNWVFIRDLFFIFALSIIFLSLLNTLFVFVINNSNGAFLLTILCIFASFTFSSIFPFLSTWNPITHSLFALHSLNNHTIKWYYLSLILYIMFIYVVIYILFKYRKEKLLKL